VIDIANEKVLTLAAAARLRPASRGNRPTHPSTVGGGRCVVCAASNWKSSALAASSTRPSKRCSGSPTGYPVGTPPRPRRPTPRSAWR
jgi:hypothetical protein